MLQSLQLAPFSFSSQTMVSSAQFLSFLNKLLSSQQNYSTFERECLANVAADTHFRVYLLPRQFVRRTDHIALTWLFSKNPKPASFSVAGSRRCSITRSSTSTSKAPKILLPTCLHASKVTPSTRSCRLSPQTALSRLHATPPTPIASSYGPTGLTSSAQTQQSLELCAASTLLANQPPMQSSSTPLSNNSTTIGTL